MITSHDAIHALREVVAGNESTVYCSPDPVKCVYAHNREPSCVVGRALAWLGWPIERLEFMDQRPFAGALNLPRHFPDDIDSDAAIMLARAQGAQDRGESWGEALIAAERVYSGIVAAEAGAAVPA